MLVLCHRACLSFSLSLLVPAPPTHLPSITLTLQTINLRFFIHSSSDRRFSSVLVTLFRFFPTFSDHFSLAQTLCKDFQVVSSLVLRFIPHLPASLPAVPACLCCSPSLLQQQSSSMKLPVLLFSLYNQVVKARYP